MTARILIVDDTPVNLRLFEAKLTAEYFEVLTAGDGPSGLDAADREQPDLILLDVMMPGMDGFEVCRRLRSNPRTRHIPVVMVTALTDVADRVRGLEAGADDFLSKPVNDIALFARVRSLVRLKTLVDELRDRQAAAGLEVIDEAALGGGEVGHGRVLLVDGHQRHRERLAGYLRGAGHEVTELADLRAALEHCQSDHQLDLVVVSIEVDGQDGLRLCGQLRSNDATRYLPILLVLEDMDLPRLAKGLDLGVTDYLFKPIDQNELLARVRTQIRRRRYHEGLRLLLDRSMSMAYTDPLTGAYNRGYMETYMRRKLREIAETGKPLAVMLFDLDRFKEVNDTHGHAAGDDVLQTVCRRVTENVRDVDLLARYGGEEFVVVMPDTNAAQAQLVAERVRRRMAELPIRVEDSAVELTVTLSAGVAVTEDPAETPASLLQRADTALYEAKRNGRNRVALLET